MEHIIGSIIAVIIIGFLAMAIIKICIKLFPLLILGAALFFGAILFATNESSNHSSLETPSAATMKKVHTVYKKAGVNLETLQPVMGNAIGDIAEAFQNILGKDYIPTITSGDDFDGHCEGSAHYSGAALDFRLKDIDDPHLREKVAIAVRETLGKKFFVNHEFPGESNEHLHVQMRKGTYNKYAAR